MLNYWRSIENTIYLFRRIIMVVDKETCIGCGTCKSVCPVEAIDMVDGKAKINKEICISCGACKASCPVEAISED